MGITKLLHMVVRDKGFSFVKFQLALLLVYEIVLTLDGIYVVVAAYNFVALMFRKEWYWIAIDSISNAV